MDPCNDRHGIRSTFSMRDARDWRRTLAVVFMVATWICPSVTGAVATPPSERALDDPALPHADRAAFADPPIEARPWIRWWWPGGDVDDAELSRELALIRGAGFGGAEIQSFAFGLPAHAAPGVRTYGEPPWLGHVAHAVREAARLGLSLDLTLGSAWPSGGDHVTDADSLKQLTVSVREINGPVDLNESLPLPEAPLYDSLAAQVLHIPQTYDGGKMRRVCVVAANVDGDAGGARATPAALPGLPDLAPTVALVPGSSIVLDDRVTAEGKLRWSVPPGRWLLFALYAGPTGTRPFYGADRYGGRVLDHLSRRATNRHLDVAAGRVRDVVGPLFGTTLRSIFVDSLELRTELYWTDDFAEEFAKRRGYRVEPFLPVLFQPLKYDTYMRGVYPDAPPVWDMGGDGERVRYDYERTVSELMLERFFGPIASWAESNGVAARVQAHGGPADLIAAYGSAQIPETEGLYAGGTRAFLKVASSAAHLHRRQVVSSEMGVFRFLDYAMTPDALIRDANKHLAAGANQLVVHGFPYVYHDQFSFPGWMPFSSPYLLGRDLIGTFSEHYNDRNTLWRYMRAIGDAIARAQVVLRTGRSVAEVALYTGWTTYPDALREPEAVRELEDGGYTFDYVNDDALISGSALDDRGLRIGDGGYHALVIAGVAQMRPELVQRITELAAGGLPIVFVGRLPTGSPGYLEERLHGADIRGTLADLVGGSAGSGGASSVRFVADAARLPEVLREDLAIPPAIAFDKGAGQIRFAHRRSGTADYYFITNSSSAAVDSFAVFANASKRLPEIWDVFSGRVYPPPVYKQDGDNTGVALHLEAGAALLLGFEEPGEATRVEATNLPDVKRDDDGTLAAVVDRAGTYTLELADDDPVVVRIEGPDLPSLPLPTWNLVALSLDADGETQQSAFLDYPLQDLAESDDLQSFSGSAIYRGAVDVPSNYFAPGLRLELDLGEAYGVAEIRVGTGPQFALIGPAYRLDLTDHLRPGRNEIEVAITTTLRNLLVGLGETADPRYAQFVGTARMSSGLVGPVSVRVRHQFALDEHLPIEEARGGLPFVAGIPIGASSDPAAIVATFDEAASIARHVSLRWLWGRLPRASGSVMPGGASSRDCASVAYFVEAARRRGLAVILQLDAFRANLYDAGDEPTTVDLADPSGGSPDGVSLSDPDIRSAYLAEIECLASLRPDALVLGSGVNLLIATSPDEYDAFTTLTIDAYVRIKRISATTRVGLSFQYDLLRNIRPDDAANFVRASGAQDFILVESHPGASSKLQRGVPFASDVDDDHFAAFRRALGSDLPIAVETGWPSATPFGRENQMLFLRRLGRLVADMDPIHVIWSSLVDSADSERTLGLPAAEGLLSPVGEEKPAWQELNRLRDLRLLSPLPLQPPRDRGIVPVTLSIVPPNWPRDRSETTYREALVQAGEIDRHVSLQLEWRDRLTGGINDCRQFEALVGIARELGLEATLQFNTYTPLPPSTAGDALRLMLRNPFLPTDDEIGGPPAIRPSMTIQTLREAYIEQVACLAALEPPYLVLGPEVNFIYDHWPEEFTVFAEVYAEAYRRAKEASPDTLIGVSYQYDLLRDLYQRGRGWTVIDAMGPQDFVAFTSYYDASDPRHVAYPVPTTIPADYYEPIRDVLGPDVKVIFTELGWSSHYAAGEQSQVIFVDRWSELLARVRPAMVIWPLQHDVAGYFTGIIEPINKVGLRDSSGRKKPVWDEIVRLKREGTFVPVP
jgi:hypothetical protein